MNQSSELNRFKVEVNLVAYASDRGYQVDKGESSRNSVVMRYPATDDKIIIARGQDGHWTYFSVRDLNDNGSIIDFLQKRAGKNLGETRKELRPWIGKAPTDIKDFKSEVEPTVVDRNAVQASFEKTKPVYNDRYLQSRGLTRKTLNSPRFHGKIRQDLRANIVFPHHDREGVSGFEIKNKNFTGFSRYGIKSVWHSRIRPEDTRLVFVESAIDGLSYHQIKGDDHTRYMSTGGQMSSHQENLVKAAIKKMPPGSQIIAAFDKDREGERYFRKLQELASDKPIIREVPEIGKDWNDHLKETLKHQENNLSARQEMALSR